MLAKGKGFALMSLVKWMFALLLVSLVGCGGTSTTTGVTQRDYQALRTFSVAYEGFLKQNKGKPPADEAELRSYLTSRQSDWDAVGISIDDMLTSPHSGEPLVVVYGKKPPVGKTGLAYVAYDKTPINGKHLVVSTRGVYEEMDETQFKSVFPDAT
jgi:hypothetical protein